MKEQKKILLVEDDNDLRRTFKDKLYQEYIISEAEDGEQAIEMCVSQKPDLVLLDLLLPKLDGFKVLERIRNYPDPKIAQAHVIVLSNLWSEKDIIQAQGLKIDEYFVKAHTTMNDVVAKINQVIGK